MHQAVQTSKTVTLLEEVIQDLLNSNLDLVACFRKSLLAFRMLAWQEMEGWTEQELNGYNLESVPSWRRAHATLKWVAPGTHDAAYLAVSSPAELMPEATFQGLNQPLGELIQHRQSGFRFSTSRKKRRKGTLAESRYYKSKM